MMKRKTLIHIIEGEEAIRQGLQDLFAFYEGKLVLPMQRDRR